MKKRRLVAVGGDIFAGTFTLGVTQAGFEVPVHLAHCNYGNATARLNFPELDIRTGVDRWDLGSVPRPDLMFTNPPCAVWSVANTQNSTSKVGWQRDPRLLWVRDLSEAGQRLGARTWCWESVVPAWTKGREFVLDIAHSWVDLGYNFTILLQNNMHLGAPQDRKRMFAIAHRHPLVWPALRPADQVPTVEEVLRQAPRAKPSELKPHYLNEVRRGLWEDAPRFGGMLRRAGPAGQGLSFLIKRYRPDQIASVMFQYEHKLHPTQPRHFTWEEWLAFHGLPPEWQSSCKSMMAATGELTRAVLAPVGRWLATAIRDGLEQPALRRPAIHLADLRDPEDVREEIVTTPRASLSFALPTLQPKPVKPGAPVRAPREPSKPGSGARIRELILSGAETHTIVATIHREFPTSKATKADVYYHRGKLRQEGQL